MKVEVDGKMYCVETLIFDNERLRKEVIASAELHRLILDKIRAEILEEKEYAYADFDQYKVDYLGVDSRYVEDELPYDDFRYGMERCIEILDKYRERSDKE